MYTRDLTRCSQLEELQPCECPTALSSNSWAKGSWETMPVDPVAVHGECFECVSRQTLGFALCQLTANLNLALEMASNRSVSPFLYLNSPLHLNSSFCLNSPLYQHNRPLCLTSPSAGQTLSIRLLVIHMQTCAYHTLAYIYISSLLHYAYSNIQQSPLSQRRVIGSVLN